MHFIAAKGKKYNHCTYQLAMLMVLFLIKNAAGSFCLENKEQPSTQTALTLQN